MYYDHYNKIIDLLKISEEINYVDHSFKDREMHNRYCNYIENYESNRSKIFFIFSILSNIFWMFTALNSNNYYPSLTVYLQILIIILEILAFFISFKCLRKYRKFHIHLKYIRFFLLYSGIIKCLMYAMEGFNYETNLKLFFRAFLFIFTFDILFLDFNMLFLIITPFINFAIIIIIQIYYFQSTFLINEILINFCFYIFAFFIKKNSIKKQLESFLDLEKKNCYLEYMNDLLSSLNTMIISFKQDNEVIYLNKISLTFFEEFVKKGKQFMGPFNTDILENENIFGKGHSNIDLLSLEDTINSFLISLTIDESISNIFPKIKGNNLKKILSEIISGNDYFTKEFNMIGTFSLKINETICYSYQLFFRKVKFREKVIDLLLYDISDIKLQEKLNITKIYKQQILGTIAQQLKSPLFTICRIIKNMTENKDELPKDGISLIKLKTVKNLSNYTQVLISNILGWVSGIKLKKTLEEIDLKEILCFCYEILRTLVECDQSSVCNVETRLEMQRDIEHFHIESNETALKHILINFISNSVKFTKLGFIKIMAFYNNESNTIEIILKDTGIGIKEEDQLAIFKEIFEYNLNNDSGYKNGNGIGLYICKSLADSLGHQIGFISQYNVGSQFYIKLKKKVSTTLRKNTAISTNEIYITDKIVKEQTINKNQTFICEDHDSSNIKCSFSQDERLMTVRTLIRPISLNTNRGIRDYFVDERKIEIYEICNEVNLSIGNYTNSNVVIVVVDILKSGRETFSSLLISVFSEINLTDYNILGCEDAIDLLHILKYDKKKIIKWVFINDDIGTLNTTETIKLIKELEKYGRISNYNIILMNSISEKCSNPYLFTTSKVDYILKKPCTKSDLINYFKSFRL